MEGRSFMVDGREQNSGEGTGGGDIELWRRKVMTQGF